MVKTEVERLEANKGAACEEVLRALPKWFGVETAVQAYIRDVESMPCFAVREDGRVLGFMALAGHSDWSREIHVMGVRPECHNRGLGRALVMAAKEAAIAAGVRWLIVRTMGPSRADVNYAATRSFYLSCGFEPIEELQELWPAGSPSLLMVMRL